MILTCRARGYEPNKIWTGQIRIKMCILWGKQFQWHFCKYMKTYFDSNWWKIRNTPFLKTPRTVGWFSKISGLFNKSYPKGVTSNLHRWSHFGRLQIDLRPRWPASSPEQAPPRWHAMARDPKLVGVHLNHVLVHRSTTWGHGDEPENQANSPRGFQDREGAQRRRVARFDGWRLTVCIQRPLGHHREEEKERWSYREIHNLEEKLSNNSGSSEQ